MRHSIITLAVLNCLTGLPCDLEAADPPITVDPAQQIGFKAEKDSFYQIEKSAAGDQWKPWGDPIKGTGERVTRFAASNAKFRVKELTNQWALVWRDEFDGKKLDTTKWAREENGYGGGNNERQFYSTNPKYCYVKDGLLHQAIYRDPHTTTDGKKQPYSSARIRTLHRGEWQYGKFEVRAKVPGGEGIWPAIWMLPTQSKYGTWAASGEIDILESRGTQIDQTIGTIHFGGQWPRNKYKGKTRKLPGKNAAEAFHVYAIEWEKDEIRWYVDGKKYSTITKDQWFSEANPKSDTAPFDQPFHLIINLAVDGGFFNGTKQKSVNVPDKAFPQILQVDYVRVYQWAK
jgi:beta-glucanase (GH16 family)